MLIRRAVLEAIREGRVTLAFRRWRRPTVCAGGTLTTSVGLLYIAALDVIDPEAISEADAAAAGYSNRAALRAELDRPGTLWRITLHWAGEDPRHALAAAAPDAAEAAALRRRLDAMDVRGDGAPWTRATLGLIDAHPGAPAADLAARADQPREAFKRRVRRLKALGLTESLGAGYRLSPRGKALLEADERKDDQDDGGQTA